MVTLHDLRKALETETYTISDHADTRMRQRHIPLYRLFKSILTQEVFYTSLHNKFDLQTGRLLVRLNVKGINYVLIWGFKSNRMLLITVYEDTENYIFDDEDERYSIAAQYGMAS